MKLDEDAQYYVSIWSFMVKTFRGKDDYYSYNGVKGLRVNRPGKERWPKQ
jgi:hypothetical protein